MLMWTTHAAERLEQRCQRPSLARHVVNWYVRNRSSESAGRGCRKVSVPLGGELFEVVISHTTNGELREAPIVVTVQPPKRQHRTTIRELCPVIATIQPQGEGNQDAAL